MFGTKRESIPRGRARGRHGPLGRARGCASAPAPTAQSEELSGVRVETGSGDTRVVLLGGASAQPTAVEERPAASSSISDGVSAAAEGADDRLRRPRRRGDAGREGAGARGVGTRASRSRSRPTPTSGDADGPRRPRRPRCARRRRQASTLRLPRRAMRLRPIPGGERFGGGERRGRGSGAGRGQARDEAPRREHAGRGRRAVVVRLRTDGSVRSEPSSLGDRRAEERRRGS